MSNSTTINYHTEVTPGFEKIAYKLVAMVLIIWTILLLIKVVKLSRRSKDKRSSDKEKDVKEPVTPSGTAVEETKGVEGVKQETNPSP